MPNKSDKDDAMQTIREVSGTIVKTIGSGDRTVWVVEFPSQESFLKAEKTLVKDKHLNKIQRNYVFTTQTNDQFFPSQTYLPTLNVINAWNSSPGEHSNTIAVIDTGVSLKNMDLAGKCDAGYDCNKDREQQKDTAGHGTMVSTTAAAINNNFLLTAGPARNTRIFPINAYVKKIGGFPTETLIEAMDQCIARGIKIVNMSLNHPDPRYSISNSTYNSVLHSQFQTFHDNNGGLVFNAAGNDGNEDRLNPRYSYLIVVSALDNDGHKAYFSKYGNPVWFTAPGVGIVCSSKSGKGKAVSVSGTSFSSPLVASIAALIWGAKPSLSNTQVEQLLISTANKNHDPDNPNYGVPNNFYGYGMPDAGKAMKTLFP
jgi:subtilisin family serine protease